MVSAEGQPPAVRRKRRALDAAILVGVIELSEPMPATSRTFLPEAASQKRSEQSPPPTSTVFPSGEKASARTQPGRSRSRSLGSAPSQRCTLPVAVSHSRTVGPCSLPEASSVPSGEKASARTRSLGPSPIGPIERRSNLPVAASHSTIVPPPPLAASVLPSGASTILLCSPCKGTAKRRSSLPVAGSQTTMGESHDPEKRILPSRPKISDQTDPPEVGMRRNHFPVSGSQMRSRSRRPGRSRKPGCGRRANRRCR
jgi:hypothetical protein